MPAMAAVLLLLLALGCLVAWLWRTGRIGGTQSAGSLGATLGDRVRDQVGTFFPARPLSRRALPRRLLRAAEQTITIGVSGTVLVPTRIELTVNPADLEPFTDATEWLSRDIAEALRQRAVANEWVLPDGPHVTITADDERPVGVPRAVGRIGALSPQDVYTLRRPGPGPGAPPVRPDPPEPAHIPDSPGPGPRPEVTGATAAVIGPNGLDSLEDLHLPTIRAARALHLRLVATDMARGTEDGSLSAILVSSNAPLVLGRSREADLRVKDRQVSARHCAFTLDDEDGTVTIEDLRSTNGTYVEGQRIDRATLAQGETLRVGGCSWRVELEDVTS